MVLHNVYEKAPPHGLTAYRVFAVALNDPVGGQSGKAEWSHGVRLRQSGRHLQWRN